MTKRIKSLLLAAVFTLTSCNSGKEKQNNEQKEHLIHYDLNHDGTCDECGQTDLNVNHIDTNRDGKCDVCQAEVEIPSIDPCDIHTDSNHDGICDVCFTENLPVVHIDANKDGTCDVCGAEVPIPLDFDILNKLNGAKHNLNNDRLQSYLSCPDTADGYKEMIKLFKKYINSSQIKTNNALTISWKDDNSSSPYTVQFSLDESFTKVVDEVSGITSKTYEINNLIPGKYYYRVKNSNQKFTPVDSFEIINQVRMISGLSNTRDLGGWKTTDNKRIKYGVAYRGGELLASCDDIYQSLGLKTDIELRKGQPQYNTSVAPSIGKVVNAGLSAFDLLIPQDNPVKIEVHSKYGDYNETTNPNGELLYNSYQESSVQGLKNGLLAYADANNFPCICHCSGGADRTGTFCFFLEGLLGVSYEDICRDYELTTICIGGYRFRSYFTDEGFDERGFVPAQVNKGYYSAMGLLHDEIMVYGNKGDSLKTCVENYLKTVVGLTDSDLTAIRNNLLEEAK